MQACSHCQGCASFAGFRDEWHWNPIFIHIHLRYPCSVQNGNTWAGLLSLHNRAPESKMNLTYLSREFWTGEGTRQALECYWMLFLDVMDRTLSQSELYNAIGMYDEACYHCSCPLSRPCFCPHTPPPPPFPPLPPLPLHSATGSKFLVECPAKMVSLFCFPRPPQNFLHQDVILSDWLCWLSGMKGCKSLVCCTSYTTTFFAL